MGDPSREALLHRVSNWAETRPDIRALILTGSYAQDQADALSDLDLEVFTRDPRRYSDSDGWISEIGSVWVCIPEQDDVGYPARLVIFEGGLKADFSMFPVSALEERAAAMRLRPIYERGYRILVDKDHLAAKLQAPTGRPVKTAMPTEEDFVGLIREFWFEAYHVAKYLKRGDLWTAKSRDWGLKELLLRMIEWHEKTLHGWDYDTKHLGTRMKTWVEPHVWEKLNDAFAHFDATDSWRALDATQSLFRETAHKTAHYLRYRYPDDVDRNISNYIDTLKLI